MTERHNQRLSDLSDVLQTVFVGRVGWIGNSKYRVFEWHPLTWKTTHRGDSRPGYLGTVWGFWLAGKAIAGPETITLTALE